jgi:5-methylcytosine-specific restriction endonuclease McrA
MAFSMQERRKVYDRTSGYCHICKKKLSFRNYGRSGLKGAWEVEHSHPQSKGGTNRSNNLFAACITCNREKGTFTTRTARSWHGRTRAPLSKEKRKDVKRNNAIGGAVIGGLAGSILGPMGIITGATLGAKFGYDRNPD